MNYKEIDLGLSVKWVDRNIGAASSEDCGLYFQRGDTVGYTAEHVGVDKNFTCDDYKWGTNYNITKYNEADGKTVLDLEDDAAHIIMGDDWGLPTKGELEELFSLEKKFVSQTRETTSDEWGEPTDYVIEDIKINFLQKKTESDGLYKFYFKTNGIV